MPTSSCAGHYGAQDVVECLRGDRRRGERAEGFNSFLVRGISGTRGGDVSIGMEGEEIPGVLVKKDGALSGCVDGDFPRTLFSGGYEFAGPLVSLKLTGGVSEALALDALDLGGLAPRKVLLREGIGATTAAPGVVCADAAAPAAANSDAGSTCAASASTIFITSSCVRPSTSSNITLAQSGGISDFATTTAGRSGSVFSITTSPPPGLPAVLGPPLLSNHCER